MALGFRQLSSEGGPRKSSRILDKEIEQVQRRKTVKNRFRFPASSVRAQRSLTIDVMNWRWGERGEGWGVG